MTFFARDLSSRHPTRVSLFLSLVNRRARTRLGGRRRRTRDKRRLTLEGDEARLRAGEIPGGSRNRDDPGRPAATLRVRPAEPGDRAALSVLCADLGYPATETEIAARLRALAELSEADAILVALQPEDALLGFVHVSAHPSLTQGAVAELRALVVGAAGRRRGVGRALLAAAEAWCVARGVSRLRVRSRVERRDAHAFYASAGFRASKTQTVFQKDLARGGR